MNEALTGKKRKAATLKRPAKASKATAKMPSEVDEQDDERELEDLESDDFADTWNDKVRVYNCNSIGANTARVASPSLLRCGCRRLVGGNSSARSTGTG